MGDAYDSVIREAQMNMPNYSMIAPAGMGELPSMDMPSGTRPPRAITSGIDLGAFQDIDSAVGSGIQGLYDMVPKSSSVGMADRISALTDELGITGVDRDAKRRARIEKNIQQSEGLGQKPGTEPADPFASALELAQELQTDASDPRRRRGRQPTVQGDSPSGVPQRSRGVERFEQLANLSPEQLAQLDEADAQVDALDALDALDEGMPAVQQRRRGRQPVVQGDSPSGASQRRRGPQGELSPDPFFDTALGRGISSVGDFLNLDEIGDYIADDVRRSVAPIRAYEAARSQRVSDAFDEGGIGAGIGQLIREAPGSVENVLRTAATDAGGLVARFANLPPIAGAANMLDQLFTGSTDDPLTLAEIFGGGGENASTVSPASPASPASRFDLTPENEALINELQALTRGSATREDAKGPEEASQGDNVAVQGTGSGDASSDLDFADLIADSKRMAQANALMQLGAGIAAGDTAKALSAAGTAATKGMQDARTLDMRRRLAKYQAGREDLARREKTRQFEKTFGLSEDKVEALIAQNEGLNTRAQLSALLDLYEGALPDEKIKLATQIQALINSMGGNPAVVGGMQTGNVSFNTLKVG